jgi:hypothetical protein
MRWQGPERAIGLPHPAFVNRLAAAIAEARSAGLPFAGIFSAYRPPAFGVGGFVDKFHSLHQSEASWAVLLVGDRSEINALAAYPRAFEKTRGHTSRLASMRTRCQFADRVDVWTTTG